jgi:hypothetical protein
VSFYIDGRLDASAAANTRQSGSSTTAIGNYINDTACFKGMIGDVRLYDRVLSAGEVAAESDQWRRGWPDAVARVPRRGVWAAAAGGGGGFQSAWAAGSNVVLTPAVF